MEGQSGRKDRLVGMENVQEQRLEVRVRALDRRDDTEGIDVVDRRFLVLKDDGEGLDEPLLKVEERRPSRVLGRAVGAGRKAKMVSSRRDKPLGTQGLGSQSVVIVRDGGNLLSGEGGSVRSSKEGGRGR